MFLCGQHHLGCISLKVVMVLVKDDMLSPDCACCLVLEAFSTQGIIALARLDGALPKDPSGLRAAIEMRWACL